MSQNSAVREACGAVHDLLEALPLVRYPFPPESLPRNGIYFFYERGETTRHISGEHPRIVRVGTHREGNFQSRMADHYVLNPRKGIVRAGKSPPRDRSIFRKNLGRALLNQRTDPYLDVWNIDFTPRANRDLHEHRRDISLEQRIEDEITERLREEFSFRYLVFDGQEERMGSGGIEAALIGTIAQCGHCQPSADWLGQASYVNRIKTSGLWLSQHLESAPLDAHGIERLRGAREDTLTFLKKKGGSTPR